MLDAACLLQAGMLDVWVWDMGLGVILCDPLCLLSASLCNSI